LELSHKREGEKESWASVPKKNFWPPAPISGVANSTASFSASDDTSSVQLSPWQRDHCWKQTVPRRLRGSQLTFYMTPLSSALHARDTHRSALRRLRRRPFELFSPSTSVNGWTRPPKRVKVKPSHSRLHNIVQRLWDLVKTSPCSVFSPRKRILREMERVTLAVEEPVKRQRPPRPPPAGNSKGVSSYSINSLLGTRDEENSPFLRTLLHSPSPKSRQQSPLPEQYGPVHPPYVYYPFQSVLPHPPYYVTGSPTHHHSLWTPYPLSSLPRGAGGPYSALVPPYASPHPPYAWPTSPDCELKREDTSPGWLRFIPTLMNSSSGLGYFYLQYQIQHKQLG